jgi:hypothetical protein
MLAVCGFGIAFNLIDDVKAITGVMVDGKDLCD